MENKKTQSPKPIIKWIGGKTEIINTLLQKFPPIQDIKIYIEPFLGGASVLINLLHHIKINNYSLPIIYAYDINEFLINMYKHIQNEPQKLYDILEKIIQQYQNILENKSINRNPKTTEEAQTSKESYYYWIRKNFNEYISNQKIKNNIEVSAMFIFLNKNCFRGMYRVSSNGFNVPFGNYVNPEIINREHLFIISDLIQNVKFDCLSYEKSLDINHINKNENCFVYLDPPYVPINKTSFVNYSNDGFAIDKHLLLFDIIKKLKCKFMMSNSDTELITENFNEYKIEKITVKRRINSKNPESVVNEVIAMNYYIN